MVSKRGNKLAPLRGSKNFSRLKEEGHQVRYSRWLLIRFNTNEQNTPRLGITLPRYVGSAVVRNRIRRWVREFFREYADQGEFQMDVGCYFFKMGPEFYKNLQHKDLDKGLQNLWTKIRIRARNAKEDQPGK